MNNAILIATVTQEPEVRFTPDNQTIAEVLVQFPGRDEDPPSQLKVTGWGNAAQHMKECEVGQQYVLEGRLQMSLVQRPEGFKDKMAEMRLSRIAPSAGILNTVHLVGRVGREPDVKYFESGSVVTKFTLAVNRRSRDSEPDWFDIEVWNRTAQVAADYVRKGSLVGITGTLKFDCWTDRNTGALRFKPVILVNQLDLLGSKRDNEGF